jgi:signal transduction histidine kinase
MKVKFFQRTGVKLSFIPMMLLLLFFIGGGAAFYFFGYQYFFKDVHKNYLMNLSSEKTVAVDMWFSALRKDIEDTANSVLLKENLPLLIQHAASAETAIKSRKLREAVTDARAAANKFLQEKAVAGGYKALVLLSSDGRILASNDADKSGEDWSGKDFTSEIASLKNTVVIGFGRLQENLNVIDTLTPVLGPDGKTAALYAVADMTAVKGLLNIKYSIYGTGKVELIDKNGNVTFTKDGFPSGKFRYNLPNIQEGIVYLRDGIFFIMSGVDQAPFRLIATVRKDETEKPFIIMIAAYAGFGALIFLILIIQSSVLSSKLITKPASKIMHMLKDISIGNFTVVSEKGYSGEFKQIAANLAELAEALSSRESGLRDNIKNVERAKLKSVIYARIAHDFIPVLSNVNGVKQILDALNDMRDLAWLQDGRLTLAPEDFIMSDMLREVEEGLVAEASAKSVEVIAECHEVFDKSSIHADRKRLKQLMMNMGRCAITLADSGAVTILVSSTVKSNITYLEISAAYSGRGISQEATEKLREGVEHPDMPFEAALANDFAAVMGGTMEIQSTAEKGSVITVSIPLKASASNS